MKTLFRIFDVIVCKVSDKSARKRRKRCDPGAFVAGQNLSYLVFGLIGLYDLISNLHLAVKAGDLKTGIKPEECVSSEIVVFLCRLKKITMLRYILKDPEHLDRCPHIGKNFKAYGSDVVLSLSLYTFQFINSHKYL